MQDLAFTVRTFARPRRWLTWLSAVVILTTLAAAPRTAGAASPIPIVGVQGLDNALWVNRGGTDGFWSLGGMLLSAPAIVQHRGTTYYFVRGTDNNVWVRTDGKGWAPFAPAGTTYCIEPAATVAGDELTVACRGSDSRMYVARTLMPPDTDHLPSVDGFKDLGGQLKDGPAIAVVNGTVTYAVRGLDDGVWTRTNSIGWTRIPTLICRDRVGLGWDGSIAYLACRGTDGQLWYATNRGAGWSYGVSVGGRVTSGPGNVWGGPGIAVANGQATVFVVGDDKRIYRTTLTPSSNSGWTRLSTTSATGGVGATTGF